ncbi:MAG: hypothetical protein RSB45_02425 [Bacilli bacterium]
MIVRLLPLKQQVRTLLFETIGGFLQLDQNNRNYDNFFSYMYSKLTDLLVNQEFQDKYEKQYRSILGTIYLDYLDSINQLPEDEKYEIVSRDEYELLNDIPDFDSLEKIIYYNRELCLVMLDFSFQSYLFEINELQLPFPREREVEWNPDCKTDDIIDIYNDKSQQVFDIERKCVESYLSNVAQGKSSNLVSQRLLVRIIENINKEPNRIYLETVMEDYYTLKIVQLSKGINISNIDRMIITEMEKRSRTGKSGIQWLVANDLEVTSRMFEEYLKLKTDKIEQSTVINKELSKKMYYPLPKGD